MLRARPSPVTRVADCALCVAVVSLAALRGPAWKDKLVLAAVDNDNAVGWLRDRSPRNRMARVLLKLLSLLEARHGFQIYPLYVRTYHNDSADHDNHNDGRQRRLRGTESTQ